MGEPEFRATTFDLSALPNMDFGGGGGGGGAGAGSGHSQSTDYAPLGNDAVTPCKSLLSALMKTSFSMSSLRDGSPDTEASSVSSPATLPRRKRRDGRRRHVTTSSATQRHRRQNHDQQAHSFAVQQQPTDKRDEFWEALQSNYDYLMDGGLIETCKEANGELSWDDEDLEVPCTWTFKEFLDRHSELSDWLEGLRAALDRSELECCGGSEDKRMVVVHPEETKYRASQMKLFNEQSRRLERRYPNMRDEILCRTDHLNARWAELEGALALATDDDDDDGDQPDEITVLKGEIARQIRWLRKWLREVDEQIGPLTLSHEWSNDDILGRLKQQQTLQREIESRCKCVLAVVKLCEKFRRRYEDESSNKDRWSSSATAAASSSTPIRLPSETKAKRKGKGQQEQELEEEEQREDDDEDRRRIKRIRSQRGSDHTVRVAQNLQRRFHALWIRSLEWQCWLEGLLSAGGAQRHQLWKDCRSPGDEPKRKCPRLIGAFQSRVSGMVVPEAAAAATVGADSSASSDASSSFTVTATSAMQKGQPPKVFPLTGDRAVSVRGHDHHDVGYSSESSAHLSNEESAGEFVRVYTYTTAEATTPRVLEVVVDGERRPRKTPPRELAAAAAAIDGDARVSTTPVENAGSNCGTFYFCHEDSDGAGDHRHISSRAKLDFSSPLAPAVVNDGVHQSKQDHPSSSSAASSSSSSSEGDDCGAGDVRGTAVNDVAARASLSYPKGIHRLVKQAELLVKSPYNMDGKNGECRSHRRVTGGSGGDHGSSCDASGEYTTSGSDSDVSPNSRSSGSVVLSTSSSSSTSSCEDYANGSVINLQKSVLQIDPLIAPTTEGANSGGSDPGAGAAVRLRRKKRVNRDWRLSSGSIDSSQCVNAKRLELCSLSEGALNVSLDHHRSSKVTSKVDVCQRKFARCSDTRRASRDQRRRLRRHGTSLVSLRHSGSSDSGRWKCVEILPSSGSTTTSEDDGTLLVDESSFVAATPKDKAVVPQSSLLVVNAVIDDFSSMSEQAWDDYQDPPYLSDAYSEKALDGEDASVRRLLEFGDDYRAYMESGNASDGTSTPSLPVIAPVSDNAAKDRTRGRTGAPTASSSSASSSRIRAGGGELILDSESDLDDLEDVVKRHRQQLDITRQRLRSLGGIDDSSDPRVSRQLTSGTGEVLATCETHIRCLENVWAQLTNADLVVLSDDVSAGVYRTGEKLRDDWRKLLMESREFQRQLCQLGRLQNEVKQLRDNVESLHAKLDEQNKRISKLDDRTSLDVLLVDLKDTGDCLEGLKLSLARTNFNVHAYARQTGRDIAYLKADVVELYRTWDRSHERLQTDIVELRKLKVVWDDYEARRDTIMQTKVPKMVVEGLTGCSKVDLEVDLAAFRGAAALLKMSLESSSPAWEVVSCETKLVVERVYAFLLDPAALEPVVCGNLSRTNRAVNVDAKTTTTTEVVEKSDAKKVKSSSSLLWRVIKAAVPFQLTLVVLFCLACFLEPHCCDNVNNMHYSLTPQLRYVRGPPPI